MNEFLSQNRRWYFVGAFLLLIIGLIFGSSFVRENALTGYVEWFTTDSSCSSIPTCTWEPGAMEDSAEGRCNCTCPYIEDNIEFNDAIPYSASDRLAYTNTDRLYCSGDVLCKIPNPLSSSEWDKNIQIQVCDASTPAYALDQWGNWSPTSRIGDYNDYIGSYQYNNNYRALKSLPDLHKTPAELEPIIQNRIGVCRSNLFHGNCALKDGKGYNFANDGESCELDIDCYHLSDLSDDRDYESKCLPEIWPGSDVGNGPEYGPPICIACKPIPGTDKTECDRDDTPPPNCGVDKNDECNIGGANCCTYDSTDPGCKKAGSAPQECTCFNTMEPVKDAQDNNTGDCACPQNKIWNGTFCVGEAQDCNDRGGDSDCIDDNPCTLDSCEESGINQGTYICVHPKDPNICPVKEPYCIHTGPNDHECSSCPSPDTQESCGQAVGTDGYPVCCAIGKCILPPRGNCGTECGEARAKKYNDSNEKTRECLDDCDPNDQNVNQCIDDCYKEEAEREEDIENEFKDCMRNGTDLADLPFIDDPDCDASTEIYICGDPDGSTGGSGGTGDEPCSNYTGCQQEICQTGNDPCATNDICVWSVCMPAGDCSIPFTMPYPECEGGDDGGTSGPGPGGNPGSPGPGPGPGPGPDDDDDGTGETGDIGSDLTPGPGPGGTPGPGPNSSSGSQGSSSSGGSDGSDASSTSGGSNGSGGSSATSVSDKCGNGEIDPGEECDNGSVCSQDEYLPCTKDAQCNVCKYVGKTDIVRCGGVEEGELCNSLTECSDAGFTCEYDSILDPTCTDECTRVRSSSSESSLFAFSSNDSNESTVSSTFSFVSNASSQVSSLNTVSSEVSSVDTSSMSSIAHLDSSSSLPPIPCRNDLDCGGTDNCSLCDVFDGKCEKICQVPYCEKDGFCRTEEKKISCDNSECTAPVCCDASGQCNPNVTCTYPMTMDECSESCITSSSSISSTGRSTSIIIASEDDEFIHTRSGSCGNGKIERLEMCDDGNTRDGDGCNRLCAFEPQEEYTLPTLITQAEQNLVAAASVCGNGILDSGEECDDTNRRDNDGCSSSCLLEIGICGDGIVQTLLGEQCEGQKSCQNCRYISPTCGDGKVDQYEECDEGPLNSTSSDAACRPDCSLSRCGDAILDSTEICDDGNRLNNDGCDRYCVIEESDVMGVSVIASDQNVIDFEPVASVPVQVQAQNHFQFPQYPNYQQVPYQLPLAQLQPLIQSQGPIGDTGPAAVAVVASGMAAGMGWVRRKKK